MSQHVLMFGWEYPPCHLGGLGVACQGLVRGLLHHGARVTLVLPQKAAPGEENLTILSPGSEQLQTLRIRSALRPYDSAESFAERARRIKTGDAGMELYGSDLGGAVYAFEELSTEMTKDIDAHVVHSHDWMTYGAGMRAAAHKHIPFVAHVHATELDRTHFRPNEWIYGKERAAFSHAAHIITVSNYTKNILTAEYGIAPEKIAVIHNGASDRLRVNPLTTLQSRHPLVLFVGRLTVQKGPFHFLEAARMVHALRPDVQFVVAGEGYLLPELIGRACDMGLQDAILFSGKVNGEEARALYLRARCFVMPSTSEPFGLVALEAIAHGVPTIVSKQSGVREVVPDAFHVDFWDTEKLADCILTILREEPLALQLTSEAPRVLIKLTWENQAAKVLSIYDHVLHCM